MRSRFEMLAARRATLALVIIACLAVTLPVAIINAGDPLTGDEVNYAAIGMHLANGEGFTVDGVSPTAMRTFAYPFFLSLIFRIFGVSYLAVHVVQTLLSCVTCLLVWRIAKHVTGSYAVALVSALLYIVYPGFIRSAATVLTENLTIFFTVLMVYFLVVHRDDGVRWYALAGIAGGLATLTRPGQLLVPAMLSLPVLMLRGKGRRPLLNAAALVIASVLVVVPWSIRSSLALQAFVPISTQGGYSFWPGTVDSDGEKLASIVDDFYSAGPPPPGAKFPVKVSDRDLRKIESLRGRLAGKSELDYDRLLKTAAVQNIREDTGLWLRLGTHRLLRLWFNIWPGCRPTPANYGIAGLNSLLIIFAMVAVFRRRIDSYFRMNVLLLALYTSLIGFLIISTVRFSYSVFPFVIVLSASGLCSILDRRAQCTGTDSDLTP